MLFLKRLETGLKLSILLIMFIVGLILFLSEVPDTESIELDFILTKIVAFILFFLFYKHFPFKLVLEEDYRVQLSISLLAIVLFLIVTTILSFIVEFPFYINLKNL